MDQHLTMDGVERRRPNWSRPIRSLAEVASQPPVGQSSSDPAMPTVAIALSGGGAAGVNHVHALAALDELKIRPVAISGTSMGALVGAAYAAGFSARMIEQHILQLSAHPLATARRFLKSNQLRQFFSALSLDPLGAVETALPPATPNRFERLKIPFKVAATDFHGRCSVIFDKGDLRNALAASIAIPGLFKPHKIAGRIYVDGGVTNNLPIDALPDADIVLAINAVGAPPPNIDANASQIAIVQESMRIMVRSRLAQQLQERPNAILIEPDGRRIGVMEFHKVGMLLRSPQATRAAIKQQITNVLATHKKALNH